jgi:hypothetical protein
MITTPIECDIERYSGSVSTSIPPSEAVKSHHGGPIELYTGIESAAVDRPRDMGGLIFLCLRLPRGGLLDLILPPEAAEAIGLALIRAKVLPVAGWTEPSEN